MVNVKIPAIRNVDSTKKNRQETNAFVLKKLK